MFVFVFPDNFTAPIVCTLCWNQVIKCWKLICWLTGQKECAWSWSLCGYFSVFLHALKGPFLLLMCPVYLPVLQPVGLCDKFVCVTVISTACTYMHVSCLTLSLPLNSLSLTKQQHGRPSPGGLITCHSSPVTSSQIQDEFSHPRCSPLTLPLWMRQRPFEGCPCLIPPPHSASMACVYQPVQVRLEKALHEGGINRQEKSMWAA